MFATLIDPCRVTLPEYKVPPPQSGKARDWFFFFLRPNWKGACLAFGVNLLRQVFFRLFPLFFGILVGMAEAGTLQNDPVRVIWFFCIFIAVFVLITLTQGLVFWGIRSFDVTAKQMALYTLRHYFTLSEGWHENRASGEKLQRILKAKDSVFMILIEAVWGIIQIPAILLAVALSVLALSAPFYYVLLFFGMVGTYIALSFITGRMVGQSFEGFYKSEETLVGSVYEFLISTATVRFLNLRRYVMGQADSLESVNHRDRLWVLAASFKRWMTINSLALFWIVVIAGLATWDIYHGSLSIAAYTTIVFLTVTTWYEIEYFANLFVKLIEYWEGFKRLVEVLNQKPAIVDAPNAAALSKQPHQISFENVQFDYAEEKSVITDFNLQIAPGEKIALIGPSGAGKSTIVKLLLRFYDVNAGQICFDNIDIRALTRSSLQENIAVIPQDSVLFNHSILENIRFGRITASDEEVFEAARLAFAHDFILDLPDGYATKVGERGVKLSGGQRQRVAIARAILKNAPILVLDEATSALDSESEQLIQQSFESLMTGKTVIAIAHRLSTIAHMDRLIVMDQGRIVEQGHHEILLSQQGLYAKLWEMQSGGFFKG